MDGRMLRLEPQEARHLVVHHRQLRVRGHRRRFFAPDPQEGRRRERPQSPAPMQPLAEYHGEARGESAYLNICKIIALNSSNASAFIEANLPDTAEISQ